MCVLIFVQMNQNYQKMEDFGSCLYILPQPGSVSNWQSTKITKALTLPAHMEIILFPLWTGIEFKGVIYFVHFAMVWFIWVFGKLSIAYKMIWKRFIFSKLKKPFVQKKWSKKPPSGQKIKKFQFCFSESKYGLSWPRSQNLKIKALYYHQL